MSHQPEVPRQPAPRDILDLGGLPSRGFDVATPSSALIVASRGGWPQPCPEDCNDQQGGAERPYTFPELTFGLRYSLARMESDE